MTNLIMKQSKTALGLVVVLFGLALSGSAPAFGHGTRFGVVVGGPFWWGPGYYAPYYYPPYDYYPPVLASPPVYIEQRGAQAPVQPQSYWYYCAGAKGYYPYVKECPGGWQRVAPQPN